MTVDPPGSERELLPPNTKTLVILQSNYVPWKGYMDLLRTADEFILYDDVQFTKNDWRNRNIIKTKDGLHWLTIPVLTKGRMYQKINETQVSDSIWPDKHWRAIEYAYSKAPHFERYQEPLSRLYKECKDERYLSRINRRFLTTLCEWLGITTRITWSMDYPYMEGKTERLVGLCKTMGANRYISGPAAKDYIQPQLFQEAGIMLEYMDYSGYPVYPQMYGPFEHKVSVLDLLFMTGPDALRYLEKRGHP
jgi:hypothetical protein